MKDISQLDMTKSYTYADYLTWEFDEMVELIKGKVFRMSPAPKATHQQVLANTFLVLGNFFASKPCRVYFAPFDVRLVKKKADNKDIKTVVQPDICVVCDLSKIDGNGCLGAPDLIVEALSPATKKKDFNEKFNLYQENCVKEYWIADPSDKTIEIYHLVDGVYQLHNAYDGNEKTVTSPLFPEFSTTWDTIFLNM